MLNRLHCLLFAALFLSALAALPATAGDVTLYSGTSRALGERWKWATGTAKEKHYWIGYSIPRLMERTSFIGSFNSDRRRNTPSLCEVLGLRDCEALPEFDDDHFNGTNEGETILKSGTHPDERILKQVGLLFEVSSSGTNAIEDIKTSNLSLHVNLNREPIYWLGETDDSSSVHFLESVYKGLQSDRLKKEAVSAIGLHSATDFNVNFLAGILGSDDSREVRKDAAFWLGQTQSTDALAVLERTAKTDESEGVRESAVFGISQMETPKADESLISLATKAENRETRKKALFWLGQKASKKATATLENVANDDPDTDVQKSALFALTQLPDDQGIDPLIKIAKTHKNARVRKEAIFWLGQSENEKALQTIIDIIKE